MAMSIISQAVFTLTIVIFISGCLPSAKSVGIPFVCPSPSAIFEKAVRRDQLKGTMKALVDMEIQTMGRRYPVRMAVMARGADSLRMEAIPLIGLPDFMLSIQGDRLSVFLPEKGEFYVGEASKHLSRFVPIPIDVRDVVSILLGTYPPFKDGDCLAPNVAEGDIRQINVLARDGDVRMSLWMKWPEQVLVRLKTFAGHEKGDYSVVFSGHDMTDPVAMPDRIIIRSGVMAGFSQTVIIRYADVEFTNEGDAQLFELAVPAGVRPIDLNVEIPPNGG